MGEETGHPSTWRLFRAHPALGLEELEVGLLVAPAPSELGIAWLALGAAEQRRREADMVAAIEHAATDPDSGWQLEIEAGHDGTHGVRMDRWKALAFERELLDLVWTAARERDADASPESRRGELDRTLRAHVLVAWDRHGYRAFIAAMVLAGLLGLHPWGDRSIGAVAVRLAAVVALVIVLRSLVERWYHRSQREPE